MKLQIKVNPETGVIEDAKFKTFGCGSAIASSSLATEWLKGKTVDEALAIKNTDIVEELALPPVKIHCSVLAEDAIKAAIEDYKQKQAGRSRQPMIRNHGTGRGHIQKLMAKQGLTEGGLRVGIKGGGCSGLSYTFSWEKEARLGRRGVRGARRRRRSSSTRRVCIYLNGTTLEYDSALMGKGLHFINPNAKAVVRLRQLVHGVTRSRRLVRPASVACSGRITTAPKPVRAHEAPPGTPAGPSLGCGPACGGRLRRTHGP